MASFERLALEEGPSWRKIPLVEHATRQDTIASCNFGNRRCTVRGLGRSGRYCSCLENEFTCDATVAARLTLARLAHWHAAGLCCSCVAQIRLAFPYRDQPGDRRCPFWSRRGVGKETVCSRFVYFGIERILANHSQVAITPQLVFDDKSLLHAYCAALQLIGLRFADHTFAVVAMDIHWRVPG